MLFVRFFPQWFVYLFLISDHATYTFFNPDMAEKLTVYGFLFKLKRISTVEPLLWDTSIKGTPLLVQESKTLILSL